ncbi:hypothetical protein HDZ31DRAFT_38631 [Schizophyllum fasciatum]
MAASDTDLENFRRYLNQFERDCQADQDVDDALANEDSALNLGMETPRTVASTPRFASRPVSRGAPSPAPDVYADVWAQRDDKVRLGASIRRRRSPPPSKLARRGAPRDMDCGICFEDATMPCRTLCCGSVFCMEHIADWLHGNDGGADSRCPSCGAVCSLSTSLAREPGLHVPIPHPPPPYPTPLHTSPLSPSPPSESSLSSDHDQSGPGFSDGDTEASPVRHAPPKTLSAAVREPDFAANMVGKLLSIAALIIFYYVILNKSAPPADADVVL